MIQFDKHMFQMGWFNHLLVILVPQNYCEVEATTLPETNIAPENGWLED